MSSDTITNDDITNNTIINDIEKENVIINIEPTKSHDKSSKFKFFS